MPERELTIECLEIVYRRMKRNVSWSEEAETLCDAIVLLREQETTFVKEEDRTNHYHCEKCGYVTGIIARMHKYCPECGRKVKWDA